MESVKIVDVSEIEDKDCMNPAEILMANMESIVEVALGNEWIAGRILTVQLSGNDGIVMIQGDTSVRMIQLSKIASIRVPSHPPPKFTAGELKDQRAMHRLKTKVKKKTLRVNLKNMENRPSSIQFRYLTKGLTWTPSYKLAIQIIKQQLSPQATLSLQCFVMNDTEEVKVDTLVCSTLDPYLKYADVRDSAIPRTLSIADFYQALHKVNATGFDPAVTKTMSPFAKSFSDSLQAQEFQFSNVILAPNDRLYLPALQINLEVKSVIHVHLSPSGSRTYFSLQLTNNSDKTWPAGPIIITETETNNCFSQTDLPATAPGQSSLVDLYPEYQVQVSSDQKKNEQIYAVTGSITNSRSTKMRIIVTAAVVGDLVQKEEANVQVEDGISYLSWEFEAEPKESRKLFYSFMQKEGLK